MIPNPTGPPLNQGTKPFRIYARACLKISQDDFCQCYPAPFLLYSTLAAGGMMPVNMTRTPTVDRLVVGDTPQGVRAVSHEEWYIVYELTSQSQPAERISLGCSSSCDVKLDDASVSRVHAFVNQARHGYYLEDANSSAGTALNGEILESSKTVQLSTGDRISLGNIDLIFLLPADFYNFVRRLAGEFKG